MFGVYLEDAGVALRGTFIISPEGKLMNSECNFLNMGRNIDELMRKFKANLYLVEEGRRRLPGQVEGRRRCDPDTRPRDGREGPRGPAEVELTSPGAFALAMQARMQP